MNEIRIVNWLETIFFGGTVLIGLFVLYNGMPEA